MSQSTPLKVKRLSPFLQDYIENCDDFCILF
jgi:hypothetical protein